MPEKEIRVKTYLVVYVCDACGEGNMEWNGMALTSNPPLYPHSCSKCKAERSFREIKYPHTIIK